MGKKHFIRNIIIFFAFLASVVAVLQWLGINPFNSNKQADRTVGIYNRGNSTRISGNTIIGYDEGIHNEGKNSMIDKNKIS